MRFRRKHADTPKQSGLKNSLSFVAVVAMAILFSWLIIAFVFESYQVDGPSMQETLHNNDRLIVWKAPITWSKITGGSYIPNRGDIIIFKEFDLYGQPGTKQLIKRVVALPGDHLVIKNGIVTIYNKEHPKGFTSPYDFDAKTGHSVTDGEENIHLQKDQIFVMGDNRPNSYDSRRFGPINSSQIVGKLVLRDWPLSDFKLF